MPRSFWFASIVLTASAAGADELSTLRQQVQELQQQLAALQLRTEERIAALEAALSAAGAGSGTAPAVSPAAPAAPAVATAVPLEGGGALPYYGSTSGAKLFNPDTAMIGNFLAVGGKSGAGEASAAEFREGELGLQAIVDPYARADFFLAFGEEGVEVEEAYATFPSLPGRLLVKVGRTRASFGKVNAMHLDTLPFVDQPLPVRNLLASDEGLIATGGGVSRILPAPGDLFLEGTFELFRGQAEGLFESPRKRDLLYLGRLRGFHDLGEDANLELGGSFASGPNGAALGQRTRLYGLDASYRWKPLRRALYKSLLARAEFYWSDRELEGAAQRAFGFYAFVQQQLARRWFLGGRYDQSERPDDSELTDRSGSLIVTFWPSEFSQLRGQYRFTDYAAGEDAHELLFQLQFNIGAHGAHSF